MARHRPDINAKFGYTADGIHRSLDETLIRLGLDYIDIIYMHDPDDLVSESMEVVYPVLDDLRRQGVIKAVVGEINTCEPAIEIMSAVDLDIVLIAGSYTLLDQSAQRKLSPIALERG